MPGNVSGYSRGGRDSTDSWSGILAEFTALSKRKYAVWMSAAGACSQAVATPSNWCGYHSPMGELGKLLIFLGLGLAVIGLAIVLLGRTNLPLGKLPGDIVYRGKNTTVYFPLATSLLLSLLLSIVLYVVSRWKR